MYVLRIIIIVLIFFVLQVTLMGRIEVIGATPDLMLVLLVALVFERGPVAAVTIGFCLGFLQDLGNASFLGMNALTYSIIAYGISRISGGLFPESTVFKGVLIFAAVLAGDLISLVIITHFSVSQILYSFFRHTVLSAIYSALIGIVILAVAEILFRRVVRLRVRY